MAQAEEDEVQAVLMGNPHSRMVGGTEYSWCKAVSGGTGTTVLAVLFQSSAVPPSLLHAALDTLQARHPRLRSRLLWLHGRPALSVSPVPFTKLQVLPVQELTAGDDGTMGRDELQLDHVDNDDGVWLRLVERELNINSEWKEQKHCLEPQPMMSSTLYVGIPPPEKYDTDWPCSLLVLRLHTAICDRTSASTILTELIHILGDFRVKSLAEGCILSDTTGWEGQDLSLLAAQEKKGQQHEGLSPATLVSIEDAIPKGKADKPFWAHGLDILGYSLGSRRHATLPFENVEHLDRRSEIILKNLTSGETQKLLKECKEQKTSRLGVLMAAGLKAVALLKNLGDGSEHHAVVTLLDCRHRLDPVLPKSTVGFYHSAVLNTHLVQGEGMAFWELARRCSEAVENSVKMRKHFTDMGDVGLLMCQAMQMPHLTPWGSLRTSTLVVFEEGLETEASALEARQSAGVLDVVGCSSVHGVGPSIAIYDTMRDGALHCTCVYPSPLHSRTQMTQLLNIMMSILVNMG